MTYDGSHLQDNAVVSKDTDTTGKPSLAWSWPLEHEDRKKEAQADAAVHGAPPFQVDRKLLKDIVQEKMKRDVVRIRFLGAGKYAYSVCHAYNRLKRFWNSRHLPQGKIKVCLSMKHVTDSL